MNLNTGRKIWSCRKMPVFCFLKTDTHLYRVSVPACCTCTRLTGQGAELEQEAAAQTSVCSLRVVNNNNIHTKIQPRRAKSKQSALSSTVCSSSECSTGTLPISLVSKSADVVSGTVSGEKESSGKWSCFCKAFQAFGLSVTQGAAGKFCSCTTITLEANEVLENFMMMFWFIGAQELRTFTVTCKDCNFWLF